MAVMIEKDFDEILGNATKAIGHEYFLLPRKGEYPIFRERVYCYELYHQMRKGFDLVECWRPGFNKYRLNGEVDKGSHFEACVKNKKPDFIVHQQGSMEKNYAVMEVKAVTRLRKDNIQKDLKTMKCFMDELAYQRGIFLVYGDKCNKILKNIMF